MPETVLRLDARDNVVVALIALEAGVEVQFGEESCAVTQNIPAKHKMALANLKAGDLVYLYGMVVGEVVEPIPRGGLLTTRNVRHRDRKSTRLNSSHLGIS